MKTDKNDILIREFMQQNKKEIADYHFTDKVMQKIPARRQYDWILILATLLAAIVTLIVGKDFSISSIVIALPESLNMYYLIGAAFAFPLISGLCYWLYRNEKISVF
jgi:hypothetical protein